MRRSRARFAAFFACAVLLMPAGAAQTPPAATQPAADQGAAAATRPAGRPAWTQLSLSTCRVDEFLKTHPQSDGRGVVVAVLDTGVDPSIPGLTRTPDGQVKVIDVQDFTGDGDIELHRIRLDPQTGKLVDQVGEEAPVEYEPPGDVPAAGGPAHRGEARRWWLGTFDEKRFVNADQPDLNGNGTTEDKFPVLVTALEGDGDDQAVCYVDADLDRSFAGERPLRNYRLAFDTFTLHRPQPETQIVPLTFAVNVFLRQAKVVIHFDNGAHGTHVAGIAAGYQINNQPGFNGIAPGARLMSLKIGHGGLAGISVTESMTSALRYAARYAREHDVPVVCNLSYGVDSEIEGHSDIDKEVNEILRANPHMVFCTSAGNAGPGLSTVGTPAAATEAICVAALMAADTGRDVAGYRIDGPVVTVFSSRGGELDKPDLAAPGWSTSTVPRWVRTGDFWSGTSMASPYAAGLCALLISDALQGDRAARVRARDVRQALALSGRPVPGATPLDYGWGVPDLPQAAEVLRRILPVAKDDPVVGYEIATASPYGYKGRARAAYWRSTWFPTHDPQTFTITPVFAPTTDAAARTAFTRQFELRSLTPWCRVPQSTIYLRSEQAARAFVEIQAEQLTEPGLYVGLVEAVAGGRPEFRLQTTIVVPYEFTVQQNFTRTFPDRVVQGWSPDRYFLAVPPGASVMQLLLTVPEGKESRASFERIFDPEGKQLRTPGKRLDTENGLREAEWVLSDKLVPGIWEVPVVADRPDRHWPYDLTVRFFGLHAEPAAINAGSATKPKGHLTVTNLFEKPVAATADGQIEGFRQQKDDKFKGLKDELKYTVSLDERCNRLRLHIELKPEDYARTTDLGVMVQGKDWEALLKDALDHHVLDATVDAKGQKTLEVIIHAGFATSDDQRETPITVQIDQLLASPVTIKVGQDGEANVQFIPGVPLKLEYEAASKLENIPAGHRPVGFLRFRERSSETLVLRVPVDIGK